MTVYTRPNEFYNLRIRLYLFGVLKYDLIKVLKIYYLHFTSKKINKKLTKNYRISIKINKINKKNKNNVTILRFLN